MSQKCGSCSASTDYYLCRRCVDDLRGMLASLVSCGIVVDQVLKTDPDTGVAAPVDRVRKLAGMLEHLRGYAVGQARRGEQVRRVHRDPSTLNGDDTLASHIDMLGGCDCDEGGCSCSAEKAQQRRAHVALNRALAAGGVNTAASALLVDMHSALGQWAKHIAATHKLGLDWRTTTGFAHFLSQNVERVKLDQDAGDLHNRVRGFIRRTERIINPPVPPRECGPCPKLIEDARGRRKCATPLTADRAAVEVKCPECGETFKVADLIQRLWDDVDEWHLTRREILLVVELLDQPMSVETFKKLCTRGKKIGAPPVMQRLHPRGYRRPGEAAGEWHETRQSSGDKPVYRLVDLRKFMSDKPRARQSVAAG